MGKTVAPRRLDICTGCSVINDADFDPTYTVQWLREIKVSVGRGCFSRNQILEVYVCSECGKENY